MDTDHISFASINKFVWNYKLMLRSDADETLTV